MMTVSLHARSEEVHNKIVKGGNYQQVIENIQYLSSLKKQGKIDRLELHFTVTSLNYKEMPDMIKFYREIDAKIRFLGLDCSRDLEDLYNKINIQDKRHPDYNKLIKITHSKEFIDARDVVIRRHDYFADLEPVSFFENLRNRFKKN